MSTVEDYPFSTWKSFYAALAESFTTELFGEKYPEYEAFREEETDLIIINNLLESGASVQEGFDELLKTCIKFNRYSVELIYSDTFPSILKAFLDKGVQFDLDILLKMYAAESPQDFEDEVTSCEARGRLVKVLVPFVPDIIQQLDDKVNWDSIEPVNSEELDNPETMDELRDFIYAGMKYSYLSDEYD